MNIAATATQMPNKSYRMKIADEKIVGNIDDLEAIAQACYKILNTERYQYVIYSWNYGIELHRICSASLFHTYIQNCRAVFVRLYYRMTVCSPLMLLTCLTIKATYWQDLP